MDHSSSLANCKQAIAQEFNRVASAYSATSFLEKEIGSRLMERLNYIKLKPFSILDLGGATGFFTEALSQQYPHSLVYNLDLAEKLLEHTKISARTSRLCADAEFLPFKNQSIDFVFSNAVIHWLETPKEVFKEVHRILKHGGLFLFSMFGPDTLRELRASFLSGNSEQPINHFIDMHVIGDILLAAGFQDPVMDRETLTITYPTIAKLFIDLRSSGFSYFLEGTPFQVSQKTGFQKLSDNYEKFRDETGNLPVTVEILYGHAWIYPEPHLYHVPIARF